MYCYHTRRQVTRLLGIAADSAAPSFAAVFIANKADLSKKQQQPQTTIITIKRCLFPLPLLLNSYRLPFLLSASLEEGLSQKQRGKLQISLPIT